MPIESLLVANRGEIAIRILRAAADLRIRGTAIYSEDDALGLHVRRADEALALKAKGAAAYLDAAAIVACARDAGCEAIHPGYGFLSESADFARACADAGLLFVGPQPEVLERLGDKAAARALAESCGVPCLAGTEGATSLAEAEAFFASLPHGQALIVKAISGGGGRGLRVVKKPDELAEAMERCRSEAKKAFGSSEVYVEEYLPHVRHIEVQVAGDGEQVIHLWERECTLQRRHQKLVEVAPSPGLAPTLRASLLDAAVKMAVEIGYRNVGTFEFLVDAAGGEDARWAFIEANPRLQVEHTVTEAVTGLDLVRLQLEVAGGRRLAELGLGPDGIPEPRGYAVQVRVNMEKMAKDGSPRPALGRIDIFEPPSGPGIRVDHHAYSGFEPSPAFDSLLAKVIAFAESGTYPDVLALAARALREMRIEGSVTNAPFLEALLRHPDVLAHRISTGFVEEKAAELLERAASFPPGFSSTPPDEEPSTAGAKVDPNDPLAVLDHGRQTRAAPAPRDSGRPAESRPEGSLAIVAPVQGTVVSVEVGEGAEVHPGEPLLVMEAMKMEHVIEAPRSGEVVRIRVRPGDTVYEGHPLVDLVERDVKGQRRVDATEVDLDYIRPDLAEVQTHHSFGLDENRPGAVARRRKTGQRTARENVEDLCDEGSFVEYAPLVVAAQRRRRDIEDLRQNTPGDGMVAGIGSINGDLYPDEKSRCVVMSYDYTVLAGTQGLFNHRKKDRLFELAEKFALPLVLLSEGGGGRPGDTDGAGVAGLSCWAFAFFGRLSGLVPLVGINSGRCFAGNAALLGCCDVVIATANSNIGMGGPAMIEGGGLGVFRPEEVGPMDVQIPNGVVDIAVEDEAEAVEMAKKYLSYFQGPVSDWTCADQRLLRGLIPENRLRIYDVREVIEKLVDVDSVLELRKGFGPGMVTAL
ncbi:MAG: biotin carboxylase N-terminal domain-containing protein, partial [Myxococcota bacterium]